MSVISTNQALRVLALPVCCGLAVEFLFDFISWVKTGSVQPGFTTYEPVFFVIAAFLGAVVGWPLLAVIERLFSKYRFRYVVASVVCSITIWLLIEGVFLPSGWYQLADRDFLLNWAPRHIAFFSLLGLATGSLYTGVVALINKWVPSPEVTPRTG